MSTTLVDCMLAVQDIMGRVPGIRAAPEYPSDKVPPGPWSMVYPGPGETKHEPPGVLEIVSSIGIYVMTPRVDLPAVLKLMYPFHGLVLKALENEPTLLDTCSTFGPVQHEFIHSLNVGTTQQPAIVAGWNFTITEVKIQDTTSIDTSNFY